MSFLGIDDEPDDLDTGAPKNPTFEQARTAYLNLPKHVREVARLKQYERMNPGQRDDYKTHKDRVRLYEDTLRNYFKEKQDG